MPCRKTLILNKANASAHLISTSGFHPATLLYQVRHSEIDGRPTTPAGDRSDSVSAAVEDISEIVQGSKRFARSESGWPIVENSQLDEGQYLNKEIIEHLGRAYFKIPITLGSVLWKTMFLIWKSPWMREARFLGW